MSLAQGFPNTFSATQQTQEVLKNTDNETKKIYTDINAFMASNGHAHTGNGSDGANISAGNIVNTPAGNIAATNVQAAITELDAEKLSLTGGNLTGTLNFFKGADIASAVSSNLGTSTGNYVTITGTSTISSFGTAQAGASRIVTFAGILTLTHSTNLKLPSGANIITSIGDKAQFTSLSGGKWECDWYTRADGKTLVAVSSEQVGVPDNIVSGMKVTVGTGLQAIIGAGRAVIGETVVAFTNPLTVSLQPRMAALVTALVGGSVAKVYAQFPTVSTQTLRYILDGSPTIASTGSVANLATKTGAVNATDGRIGYSGKGDGTTGYYTCASATGVPAYSSASTRILVIDNFVSNGAIQIFHNDGISKFGCTATNNLTVNGVDTGFTMENGGAYKIALPSAASTTDVTVYVNGSYANTGAYITNTTAVTPTFYSGASGASKSPSQLAYFEYYASKLSAVQIAQISNNLLLPCQYIDNGVTKDIRVILPANSIGLGRLFTTSTGLKEIRMDYQDGRREGATGGNRRVFLGWKYYSGATSLKWDNPFGTRKIKTYYVWSSDSNGTNETDIPGTYYSSGYYGVMTSGDASGCNSPSNRISCYVFSKGAVSFNAVWQATGYIGCYAEVIE